MNLQMPENLVIAQAAGLHEQWMQALANTGEEPVELSGEQLVKVDGTGMALVLSLLKELQKRGAAWTWKGDVPEVLAAAAEDMGVARQLHPDA